MSTPAHARTPLRSFARVGLVAALVATMGGAAAAALSSAEPAEATVLAGPAEDGSEIQTLDFRIDEGNDRAALTSRILSAERAEVTFTVNVDGTSMELVSYESTLADALTSGGVVVDADDMVSLHLGDPVAPGTVVTVQRVTTEPLTEDVVDSHGTVEVESSSLYKGEEKVTTAGVDGLSTVTYLVTYVDGVETGRTELAAAVTQQRVDEVITIGTADRPAPAASSGGSAPAGNGPVMTGSNREIGQQLAAARGWTGDQWQCLDSLFQKESGWNHLASNSSSGAYGIPQSLPGSKMASVGADWRTNPATQITWGLNYIEGRYGTPCGAWNHSVARNWY